MFSHSCNKIIRVSCGSPLYHLHSATQINEATPLGPWLKRCLWVGWCSAWARGGGLGSSAPEQAIWKQRKLAAFLPWNSPSEMWQQQGCSLTQRQRAWRGTWHSGERPCAPAVKAIAPPKMLTQCWRGETSSPIPHEMSQDMFSLISPQSSSHFLP